MNDLTRRLAKLPPEKRKLLQQKILQQRQQDYARSTVIPRRGVDGPAPLSLAQRRLWFLHRFEPENITYHIPLVLKLKGVLNVADLEKAISLVVERHEVLRTTFSEINGDPVQIVQPFHSFTLDIRDAPASDVNNLAKKISRQPFNLADGPPIRFSLLQITDCESWLLVVVHHIVADGWSLNIIQDELARAYTGEISALPELPLQYSDVAIWQQENQADFKPQLEYWRNIFGDTPSVLDLPTDRSRPAQMGYTGARIRTRLPVELIESLQIIARNNGATLFMVLLSALNVLAGRLSGQHDISVGSPVAGRVKTEFEKLVGVFINTVVLRNDLSGDPSFVEFLGRVRDVTLGALSNQDMAFEKLIEELQPKRDLSRTPFFQVLLALQNQDLAADKMGDVSIERDFIETDTAMYDLSFYVHPGPDHYLVNVEYSTAIFDRDTAERMLAQFELLLGSIVATPNESISRLPLLPEVEKNQLLDSWNRTEVYYDNQATVHQLVSEQAKRIPAAVAVQFRNECCSYAELEARSNQLARHLESLGVNKQCAVGICLERSINMIVGLLGVLKAGGFYVPLDPSFPEDRLAFMVKDSGLELLLTQSSLAQQLSFIGKAQVVMLDADATAIAVHSNEYFTSPAALDDLAYVIYTSGSTGQPKGVLVQQRALVNFLHSMSNEPGIDPADRLLAVTTLSFDIAGLEIYLPLISGACVLLASRDDVLDARQLAVLMREGRASIMQATPATWRMLVDSGWRGSHRLKVFCGGESLSRELADLLLDRCAELWNLYGPTETTIWSLVKRLLPDDKGPVLVGRPIANTTVYLLDRYLQPLPIGAVGELLIGGNGLAKGYLGRDELTAERFIRHPFQYGARLYRSGDLARYHANGQLEIFGRVDHQVKVRGFRIELGEIESVLDKHPSIRQSLVVAREDLTGEKTLVAYFQSDSDTLGTEELRGYLNRSLPDYMMPSFFMRLSEFPLTPNGKVDRNNLPHPDGSHREHENNFAAPVSEMQKKLAAIWAAVLGIQRVGIRDNFFDLGGHSLLALRLVSKMEKEVGISLPLISLFQGQTIEDIATDTRDRDDELPTAMIPIRVHGTLAPFFAIGSHPRYVDAANYVDQRRPFYRLDVYALQSRRMVEGLKAYRKVEDYVEVFVNFIQERQPEGPYYLGGGCEGALIAFAIATELQRRGEKVEKLILWITPAPGYGNGAVFGKSAFFRVVDQMKTLLRNIQMADVSLKTLRRIVKHEYIELRIFRSMDSYLPDSKFNGKILFARTVENRKPWDTDLAMGWGNLATDGCRVHQLRGNHATWLVKHADEFGAFLDSGLH
jgi:amino acid adenylation domain-containing protein